MLQGSCGMEINVVGLPQGWKDIVRDSCGNVAVFDFYGASALLSYANPWVLNWNDNANWNISCG